MIYLYLPLLNISKIKVKIKMIIINFKRISKIIMNYLKIYKQTVSKFKNSHKYKIKI